MITASEAATEVGKTKAAILKSIKTGRLSALKNGKGQWQIDPVELFRVYGTQTDSFQKSAPVHRPETELLSAKIELLEIKLEKTEAQLIRELEQSDRWIREADHWRLHATALLTDQRKTPSLFVQLFGKSAS